MAGDLSVDPATVLNQLRARGIPTQDTRTTPILNRPAADVTLEPPRIAHHLTLQRTHSHAAERARHTAATARYAWAQAGVAQLASCSHSCARFSSKSRRVDPMVWVKTRG